MLQVTTAGQAGPSLLRWFDVLTTRRLKSHFKRTDRVKQRRPGENRHARYVVCGIHFGVRLLSSRRRRETFRAEAFDALDNRRGWSSTQRAAHSKERALIPVWERTQPDVWSEGRKEKKKGKKRKVPGKSERVQNFQINFKPLSPASAKPQQLSCCDLILFFCPVTPFFPRLNTSFLLEKTVPKLAGAKNNRRRSPKEANIPRTSTSSVRWCAESAPRTLGLEKHGQLINGEAPSLLKHVTHRFFRKTRIIKFISIRALCYIRSTVKICVELLAKTSFLLSFPLFWQMFQITKTGPNLSAW